MIMICKVYNNDNSNNNDTDDNSSNNNNNDNNNHNNNDNNHDNISSSRPLGSAWPVLPLGTYPIRRYYLSHLVLVLLVLLFGPRSLVLLLGPTWDPPIGKSYLSQGPN